jgi:hypothetical protein
MAASAALKLPELSDYEVSILAHLYVEQLYYCNYSKIPFLGLLPAAQ